MSPCYPGVPAGRRETLPCLVFLLGLSQLVRGSVQSVTATKDIHVTRIPCWCYGDGQSEVVRSVTWEKIQDGANEIKDHVSVLDVKFPGNVTDLDSVPRKYTLGVGLSLLIGSPQNEDAAEYRCVVTLLSNRTLSSSIRLDVTVQDDSEPAPASGLHHYLIPSIVLLILLIELTFVLALWLNLRTRTPARTTVSYIGIFKPSRVDPRDGRSGLEDPPRTPPWRVHKQSEHRLLMDDLNDGSIFERDSGFGDKTSVNTNSADADVV